MTTTTVRKSTPELKSGDIIHADGMRLMVPPRLEGSHGVVWFRAALLEESADEWTRDWVRHCFEQDILRGYVSADSPLSWVIQGNALRTFAVEVSA